MTKREVQAHLDDFGLEKEFGTFGKIRGLIDSPTALREISLMREVGFPEC